MNQSPESKAKTVSYDVTLVKYDNGKPCYETGWGFRELDVDGLKVEAHETNNLMVNLIQAKEVKSELEANPTAPFLGRTHDFYFKKKSLSIFNAFEDNYKELHNELFEINFKMMTSTDPEERRALLTERDIRLSIAWERIATIALAFNPHYKIHSLTV